LIFRGHNRAKNRLQIFLWKNRPKCSPNPYSPSWMDCCCRRMVRPVK
jgi:hypothetical protein